MVRCLVVSPLFYDFRFWQRPCGSNAELGSRSFFVGTLALGTVGDKRRRSAICMAFSVLQVQHGVSSLFRPLSLSSSFLFGWPFSLSFYGAHTYPTNSSCAVCSVQHACQVVALKLQFPNNQFNDRLSSSRQAATCSL